MYSKDITTRNIHKRTYKALYIQLYSSLETATILRLDYDCKLRKLANR